VGWTFLFPEAAAVAEQVSPREVAPASVHFRVPEADFLVPGAGSLAQKADSRELVVQYDSAELPRSRVLAVDFLEPGAAFGWAELLAYSPEVHLLSPAADSRELVVQRDSAGLPRSRVLAVDFLVLAAASCWAGLLAYSPEVHLLGSAAGSRELAEQRGSAELAHSRATAVDSRVLLSSQGVLRSACWAALLEAFQLTVATADSPAAVLLLCLPAVMLQVSHLPSSDTQLGWPA
jgi:hypothetical protein